MSSPIPERDYIVVYDGFCNVCKRLVSLLETWDGNLILEVVPSQTPGIAARFPWIPARAYSESIQVIRASDGKTWQGAAAVEQILNAFPRGKNITWLFSIPLFRPLADAFYRWFARNREQFGCSVGTPSAWAQDSRPTVHNARSDPFLAYPGATDDPDSPPSQRHHARTP